MSDLGQLYVIQFSTGTVKVGMSKNATRRLATHRAEALRHSIEIVRQWQGDPHADYVASERALVKWARTRKGATTAAGNEYFVGVDFDGAVKYAKRLSKSQIAPLARPAVIRTSAQLDALLEEPATPEPPRQLWNVFVPPPIRTAEFDPRADRICFAHDCDDSTHGPHDCDWPSKRRRDQIAGMKAVIERLLVNDWNRMLWAFSTPRKSA